MALMMSRASVSLDRQAVAPKDSIWLHSAAVGRLASTTMRVSGMGLVQLEHVGRRAQGAEVEQHHGGRVAIDGALHLAHRDVGLDQLEVGVLGDQDLEPDGDEVLELGRYTEGMAVSLRGEGGERVRKPHPRSTRFPPRRILPISLASSPRFHTAGVATKAARAGHHSGTPFEQGSASGGGGTGKS